MKRFKIFLDNPLKRLKLALLFSPLAHARRNAGDRVYQPQAYAVVLLFMLMSMVCWGSWANTMKLTRHWPFPLFYWDYVIGVLATSLLLAFTAGSALGGGSSFLSNLLQGDARHFVYALAGGTVFNVANLLLVAAIEIAGLAVAFPIGIGLALIIGVLLNYILTPRGNPLLLFGGVALIALAIVFDALAYRAREVQRRDVSRKGILVSLGSGVLMGVFYPLVARAITGEHALGPYTVGVIFALGVLFCAIPLNYFFMRKPMTGGQPLSFKEYAAGRTSFHWFGILGGAIWCLGTVLNFVASHAQLVGPAVSYAIGQGATMVSAIWGVFIWREFADSPMKARRLLPYMFVCFVVGLGAVAIAPIISF
jgi:glucose uptake protein